MAPARVRRTVDLGRVEDCLKLLSMRASFNASLAHPAHPCDARRVHVRIRKYGSSLAARWCVYRNKGLMSAEEPWGASRQARLRLSGSHCRVKGCDRSVDHVSPDVWRTDRGRLESPGYHNEGLNVRGGTLGIFAASAAATVGFALQGERLIDPSISVSPDAWRTDRGRLESPGRQSGWSLAAARQPGLGTAPV